MVLEWIADSGEGYRGVCGKKSLHREWLLDQSFRGECDSPCGGVDNGQSTPHWDPEMRLQVNRGGEDGEGKAAMTGRGAGPQQVKLLYVRRVEATRGRERECQHEARLGETRSEVKAVKMCTRHKQSTQGPSFADRSEARMGWDEMQ